MARSSLDPGLTEYLARFVTPHKLELFEQVLDRRTRHVRVVLENVYQEYNASACLRSCDGFGVQEVHVVEAGNRFRPDGEIALGASQWLTLRRHTSVGDCFAALRAEGLRLVATSPDAAATSVEELDVSKPFALVFGSEMPGLSDEAVEAADEFVRIPMRGFTTSFNVSVSVALCLAHVTRELQYVDVDWQLSQEERETVRANWVRAAIGARLPAFERRFAAERES